MTTKNFAEILVSLMEERSIKQEQLAKELGIRQSQISFWSNGKSLPGYISLEKLGEYFCVPLDYFFAKKKAAAIPTKESATA